MKFALLLILSIFSITGSALTELGVVGPVIEAKPYYEQFLLKSKEPAKGPAVLEKHDRDRVKKWTGDTYPYDSGLTAGSFTRRAFNQPESHLLMPVCLIANDAISVTWLKKYRETLLSVKPVCYLVRAENGADLTSIESLIPGVRVVAVNPRFVAEHYSVPHYPALISKQGIEQ